MSGNVSDGEKIELNLRTDWYHGPIQARPGILWNQLQPSQDVYLLWLLPKCRQEGYLFPVVSSVWY